MSSEQDATKPKEPDASTPKEPFISKHSGTILGAILGAVGAVLVGWVTSKAPYLRYTPSDTVTFQGDKNNFGIISCVVTNDGSKAAEEVTVSIGLASSQFVEVKGSPESLRPEVLVENEPLKPAVTLHDPSKDKSPATRKGSFAQISVKTLNPGESLQFVAMVSDPDSLTKRPPFTVRGKDVTGSMQQPIHWWPGLLWGFVGGLVVLILLPAVAATRQAARDAQKKQEKELAEQTESIEKLTEDTGKLTQEIRNQTKEIDERIEKRKTDSPPDHPTST